MRGPPADIPLSWEVWKALDDGGKSGNQLRLRRSVCFPVSSLPDYTTACR